MVETGCPFSIKSVKGSHSIVIVFTLISLVQWVRVAMREIRSTTDDARTLKQQSVLHYVSFIIIVPALYSCARSCVLLLF